MIVTEQGAIRFTEEEWIKLYGIETDDEGRPIDIGYNDDRVSIYPEHIWTKVDLDLDLYEWEFNETADIVNGAKWVNRMEYYFSERPFHPRDTLEVY